MPVDPRGQHQAGLERFVRQGAQHGGFGGEVVAHGSGAVGDPAGAVGIVERVVERGEVLVELRERRNEWDEVGAAEAAALALDPALLMGAFDAGAAVEGIEPVVGAGTPPTGSILTVAAE